MKTTSRRTFITQTGVILAAAPFIARSAESAADRIVLGFVGPGGQGTNLLRSFGAMKDVAIAAVCDVDRKRAELAAKLATDLTGKAPKIVKDMRDIFAEKDIDAVVIGTPDHWHAPATILACDAGKHVYVEKPCSHNIREGRLCHLGNIATRLGRTLKFDPQREHILDDAEADAMGRRKYREHWAVPKSV